MESLKTGTAHIRYQVGWPKGVDPSDAEVEMVLDAPATIRTGSS
jgi:hypothetical protein